LKIRYLTISDINYFSQVEVLFHSLRLQGYKELFWGHIDHNSIHLKRITIDGVELVKSEVAIIPKIDSIVEASTRFRPLLLEHMFDASDCEIGCYIDPDIYVYSSLEELLDESATVWITPHLIADDLLTPPKSCMSDSVLFQAYSLQRWGAFNMGIYFVRNNKAGRHFLRCYQRLLDRSCSLQSLYGFVDQKWMDVLVSIFCGQIKILSHPGINLSYWNLSFRELSQQGGQYFVNGEILRAIHFSGVGAQRINCDYGQSPIIKMLISDYQSKLITYNSEIMPVTLERTKLKIQYSWIKFIRKIMFYILAKTEPR